MNTRIRWGQASTGWDAPGWTPLVDPSTHPLQTARSVGRWLWPITTVIGFLVVTGFVLAHDDPTPGLSIRGMLTLTLAAAVVVLLTLHRRYGPRPLARALFEYAIVFLLAVLVATTGIHAAQPPTAGGKTASAASSDQRPALVKAIEGFRDWLSEWREWVRKETDDRAQASRTVPAPTLSPSTRRPL